jgi:hypothetical protein
MGVKRMVVQESGESGRGEFNAQWKEKEENASASARFRVDGMGVARARLLDLREKGR